MWFEKYKKIIFISLFIIFIFVMGFLLYYLFFKNLLGGETPITSTGTSTLNTTGLPTSQTGNNLTNNIVNTTGGGYLNPEINRPDPIASPVAKGGVTETSQIVNSNTVSATLSPNGKDIQYYNPDDGIFYRVTANGKTTPLSNKAFYNVDKITWSPNKDKAILEFPDSSNVIFNFDSQKQISLPKHWEDFDFSTNGDKIVLKSLGLDPDNRWLAMINSDGSKISPIEFIGENDANVYPSWSPSEQIVGMYTEGIDFNRQEVFFIGHNGENFKSTVVEGRDFRPMWAPDGNKLLYSVYSTDNDLKPLLWIVDAVGDNIGNNRHSLKLETWSDKCTFHTSAELYCAVPDKLEKGAGLFPEIAETTTDYLYKIDLNTGAKKLLAIPEQNYNISDLMVTEDGEYIFFTDSKTNSLHKINLK